MMRALLLSAVLYPILAAGPAASQSTNVAAVVQNVMRDICGPLVVEQALWPAISAAEGLGYGVWSVEPDSIVIGSARGQPEPSAVVFWRPHRGVIRISRDHERLLCSVGVEEGGVAQIAQAAAPHLRALGLTPLIDDRDGMPALSIWRGDGVQVVIAPSPHHRSGGELVMSIHAPERP